MRETEREKKKLNEILGRTEREIVQNRCLHFQFIRTNTDDKAREKESLRDHKQTQTYWKIPTKSSLETIRSDRWSSVPLTKTGGPACQCVSDHLLLLNCRSRSPAGATSGFIW